MNTHLLIALAAIALAATVILWCAFAVAKAADEREEDFWRNGPWD